MKKLLALFMVLALLVFIGAPAALCSDSDVPNRALDGASLEAQTGSKVIPYVGLGMIIVVMVVLISIIVGLKKKKISTKAGNVFSQAGLEAGADQLEQFGTKLCDEIWKAKKFAQDKLDEIDKEYYENLEKVKTLVTAKTDEEQKE